MQINSPKLAWLSLSLFYMYIYVLRVFPSIAESELRTDLVLSAAEFSTLGALYLAAYGILQIPLGSLVNRLGLRNVAITSATLCIIGGVITSIAPSLWLLQMGRLLFGAASAPIFMCSMKLCADHIPPSHRGLYMGVTLTMGTLGALITGNIIVSMTDAFGWRLTSAFLSSAVLPLLWLLISSIHKSPPASIQTPLLDYPSLKKVFSNKFIYMFGLIGLGLFASLSAFTDLWGTAYLIKRFDISRAEAASASMLMYIGLAIGSLLLPWYFATKQRVFSGIKICSVTILGLFSCIILLPTLSLITVKLLLFFLGLFSGGIMLVFSGASFWTTKHTSGLTISVINTFNMLGGAILNQAIGITLNYMWTGEVDHAAVPQYALSSQNYAFGIVLGSTFLITLILAFYVSRARIVKKLSRKRKA